MEQYKNTTILQGDLDSLLGCAIEKFVKGNEINYFYDFNKLYVADRTNEKKAIGIDLALHKGSSWCNHVIRINPDDYVNPKTANINAINNISSRNYFDKYAGSTALMMWSYYGLKLPDTEEGKMLLLCIDSGFLGHYDSRFKRVHNKYLKEMGFEELIDLLEHKQKSDFVKLQQDYKTKTNIVVNNEGYLTTLLPLDKLSVAFGIPLELPTQKFTLKNKFESGKGHVAHTKSKGEIDGLISFALTGKYEFKYTAVN
ncbi:hypothetical protein [Domibacillus epiphyticus]|nr:hypothetical protein [Domibacillus epiphyticus]